MIPFVASGLFASMEADEGVLLGAIQAKRGAAVVHASGPLGSEQADEQFGLPRVGNPGPSTR